MLFLGLQNYVHGFTTGCFGREKTLSYSSAERRDMTINNLNIDVKNLCNHISSHAHALTCKRHYRVPTLMINPLSNGTSHPTLNTFKPYFVRPEEFAV